MASAFPAFPVDGQSYVNDNDVTYVYSLARSSWVAKIGGSRPPVLSGDIVDGEVNTIDLANNSITLAKLAADVAAELATYVRTDGTRPFTGSLDANGQKVINLAPATLNSDAVRLDQLNAVAGLVATITTSVAALQASDATNLRRDGSVAMTGDLSMAGIKSVVGLRAATASGEAVRYDEFAPIQALASAGAGQIATLQTGKLDKTGGTLTGPLQLPAAAPLSATEATNKAYVDAMDAALSLLVTVEQGRASAAEATLMPRTGGTFFWACHTLC